MWNALVSGQAKIESKTFRKRFVVCLWENYEGIEYTFITIKCQ